jgi:serine/threonine-protein kinase HipA
MSRSRKLVVTYDGGEVGIIVEEEGVFTFTYSEKWFERGDSFEISPRFRKTRHHFSGVEVKNFLENLLPEEDNRKRIAEISKIDDRDIIALLSITGKDSAGALQIYTEEEFKNLNYDPQLVKTLTMEELTGGIKENHTAINYITKIGLKPSLSGAQDKIACRYDEARGEVSFPLAGGPTTHILKPNNVAENKHKKALEQSALNELVCLKLARRILIQVPDCNYYESKARDLFSIVRYDRLQADGAIKRIHQFDFCQYFGLSSSQKYEVSNKGETVNDHGVKQVLEAVTEVSEDPTDRERVLNWVVFNYLIHNTDSHLKNISMIATDTGFKLAPHYDITSVGYYRDGEAYIYDNHFAFSIGGESRMDEITDHHWRKYALSLGLGQDYFLIKIREMAQEFSRHFRSVYEEIDAGLEQPRNKKGLLKIMKYVGTSVEEKAYRCLVNTGLKSGRTHCRVCGKKLSKRSVLDVGPECFKKLKD